MVTSVLQSNCIIWIVYCYRYVIHQQKNINILWKKNTSLENEQRSIKMNTVRWLMSKVSCLKNGTTSEQVCKQNNTRIKRQRWVFSIMLPYSSIAVALFKCWYLLKWCNLFYYPRTPRTRGVARGDMGECPPPHLSSKERGNEGEKGEKGAMSPHLKILATPLLAGSGKS